MAECFDRHVFLRADAPPTQILTDEITPENWARFRQYAALIREVRADDVTDSRIDQSFWLHLVSKAAGGQLNLLPRLQALSYALIHPHRTSILLLLSPSLRKLSFYCLWRAENWGPMERQEAAVGMLLRAACTQCPQLDDLKLSMLEYPGPLRVAAEGLKFRLRRLELGSLEISDAATIQALAEIVTLEQLYEIHVKFASTDRISVRGFRALKDLSVICDAAEDVSRLLACVASPLESLEICSFAPTSSSWERELATLVPMVQKSLKSFMIELLPEPTGAPPETLYLSQLVEHLLPLRKLEVFSLLVRDTALITDDAAFEAISKAYPRLTSFSLDGGLVTSSATLTTLRLFAQHCPSLHTLLLPHLADEGSTKLLPDGGSLPSQGALRRLSFYLMEGMAIRDAQLAATVIAWLFPNLDTQGACRMVPDRKFTPASEDDELDEEQERDRDLKREVGRGVWNSILDLVQQLRVQAEP